MHSPDLPSPPGGHAEEHQLPLSNGWTAWRHFVLRGAGFPANHVLGLVSPKLSAAADAWSDAQEEVRRTRALAYEARRRAREAGAAPESPEVARAFELLTLSRAPGPVPSDTEPGRALETHRLAFERAAAQGREVEALLDAEADRIGETLLSLGAEPMLREALLWQNRNGLRTGVDELTRNTGASRTQRRRAKEQLLARYLQRYCTKNDSIGFFGPFGWGQLSRSERAVKLEPGEALLARRNVYFERWSVATLADKLGKDTRLRPWLAPRRMATVRVEAQEARDVASGQRLELTPAELRLLAACDAQRTARELAARLLAEPGLGVREEAEVFTLLESLAGRGLLTWTVEVPTAHNPYPERTVRAQLERVEDAEARAQALSELEALVTGRDAIARAAGTPEALDRAFGGLEETFVRLTGTQASRHTGMSSGKQLVYEDCLRDTRLELGAPVLKRLGTPLSLLLQSVRWLTWELGRGYRAEFGRLYRELVAATGSPRVEMMRFWIATLPLFPFTLGKPDEYAPFAQEALAGFQERWGRLLNAEPGARHVRRTSAQLADGVREAFGAPCPGWPSARHLVPDLMISADSVERLERGEGLFVLGELHVGNTLENAAIMSSCPFPEELWRALEAELPQRLTPLVPGDITSRATRTPWARNDLDIALDATRSWRPASQVLQVSELVVEEVDGRLCMRTRDGQRSWDILAVYDWMMMMLHTTVRRVLPGGRHMPRVTLDDLVLCREAWRFATKEVPFAALGSEAARFAGARRWAREHGLPRFVFVFPEKPEALKEPKPLYVDFESPVFVEMFAKVVRQSPGFGVSEMMPALDQLWLADRTGRRYTSELRVVTVDPEPWRAA